MQWHFVIIKYLNMVFWRFLINHSMFVIFNDTGKTAFKFGRFEYFFVFLRPVFWEIPKWRYIKMLLYYSRLFVWYIKYFKCLFQHYDVVQQHCEVTQPHSSIPPAVSSQGKSTFSQPALIVSDPVQISQICDGKSTLSWPFSVTNLGSPDRVCSCPDFPNSWRKSILS